MYPSRWPVAVNRMSSGMNPPPPDSDPCDWAPIQRACSAL